ncbi:MAG: HAD family hydrolase, partial [Planctomycetota bacterium]
PGRDVLARLATEYECRVNPVWPMPGCRELLRALHARRLPLGIVSNAQFFTEDLFEALLDADRPSLGFEPDLEVFSYKTEEAKPGEELYRRAADALAARGLTPAETLYVGNDMLNDVTPAAAVGFKTVLFAGDERSLRMREGDERVTGVIPDAIVTELPQLFSII